jgi:hypothetical protein
MVLAGNETELDRTLKELVARQKDLDDRVERLETLEGTKWDDGRGCLSFEDFDVVANAATARVDVSPTTAENGDFKASQAMIFWVGNTTAAAVMTNLYMRLNNNVGANYYYNYKYSKGAVVTAAGAGATNQLFIGRIGGVVGEDGGFSYGQVIVPFYPHNLTDHQIFGDWTGYETSAAAAARQEKGDYGGILSGIGVIDINRFDFFPAAGIFDDFQVYLYLLCPQLTPGFLPDD